MNVSNLLLYTYDIKAFEPNIYLYLHCTSYPNFNLVDDYTFKRSLGHTRSRKKNTNPKRIFAKPLEAKYWTFPKVKSKKIKLRAISRHPNLKIYLRLSLCTESCTSDVLCNKLSEK